MLKSVFIHGRFYGVLIGIIVLFILGVFDRLFFFAGALSLLTFVILVGVDRWLLFKSRSSRIEAGRHVADHLSNGDKNTVTISLHSTYPFPVVLDVIDELPVQFQSRNLKWRFNVPPDARQQFMYQVRPVERGEYAFGALHVYVASPLSLMVRRFSFAIGQRVKVYPSYLQLRKFAFLAFDKRLQLQGLKRMRKLGHTNEFEQIKEYVAGDDSRTLNWKATARTGRAMVNQFRDERAQPVYCMIDKGRLMQMPFQKMTLLDYAINTSLVMSYVAIRKEDNAGILTFAERVDDFVAAGRRNNQMYRISETLYNQETVFLEADYERLYVAVSRYLTHRSLLLLFTNFESLNGLKRQIPYLRKMSEKHIVVVIFFQNTELKTLIDEPVESLRGIYHQTIAEKMQEEKEGMVTLLRQWGLFGLLTTPQELTVDTINQYLELKARGIV
jgi:uncharacterized protein (DUF58 family)